MRDGSLDYYKRLYETVEIIPTKLDQVRRETDRILLGRRKYEIVQARTGVPWAFPACIHELECDCNFQRQILNGEKIDRVTRLVPKGLGPWPDWEDRKSVV
jgi:lysozyme family protein